MKFASMITLAFGALSCSLVSAVFTKGQLVKINIADHEDEYFDYEGEENEPIKDGMQRDGEQGEICIVDDGYVCVKIKGEEVWVAKHAFKYLEVVEKPGNPNDFAYVGSKPVHVDTSEPMIETDPEIIFMEKMQEQGFIDGKTKVVVKDVENIFEYDEGKGELKSVSSLELDLTGLKGTIGNIFMQGPDEFIMFETEKGDFYAKNAKGRNSIEIIKEPASEAIQQKEQEMRAAAAAAKKKKNEPEFKLQEKVQIFPGYDTNSITATDGSKIDVDYKTGTITKVDPDTRIVTIKTDTRQEIHVHPAGRQWIKKNLHDLKKVVKAFDGFNLMVLNKVTN